MEEGYGILKRRGKPVIIDGGVGCVVYLQSQNYPFIKGKGRRKCQRFYCNAAYRS